MVWLAGVFAAVALWERYDATPGPAGEAAAAEPHSGWRLTAFVHPHCPCSRATVRQLAALADELPQLSIRVVVVRPPNTPDGWECGELWTEAERLPGAAVACDRDGVEARSVGAETSGQVVVTDPTGRGVFRGGLTAGRGRDGESAGRKAVLGWVRGETAAAAAPVYGCPLRAPGE